MTEDMEKQAEEEMEKRVKEEMEKRWEKEIKECAYMKDLNDAEFLHELGWNNYYVFNRLNKIIFKLSEIDRLKKDNVIEKCGIDNRYKIYKLKSDVSNEKTELIDTQILKKMIPKFIEVGIILESTTEKEDQRIMELIKECQ